MKTIKELWPTLPYNEWKDTVMTLHLFTQIIGKIRLALMPPEAQWAQVPFTLTSTGLLSPLMHSEIGALDIQFDFMSHTIIFNTDSGKQTSFSMMNLSVEGFYKKVFEVLKSFGINIKINPLSVEMKEAIKMDTDDLHKAYDSKAVSRWMQVLISTGFVFEKFRSKFSGKQTPVSFFWGSFDLAQVRFNGKPADPPPGSDIIYRIAMDAQQSAVGFWPGNDESPKPVFFGYTYPKPDGIENAKIAPSSAYWSAEKGEFILPYDSILASDDPAGELLKFCESTYIAGAELAGWDIKQLEHKPPVRTSKK
ncbi:MAG: DUF5996 family protein [bacterium]|nr:DUF5996 family protein [bacterium]